jgi:peptide/nickel transport system substrate-binding protein
VYTIEQAYLSETLLGYSYVGWQPWVKDYGGELIIGGRSSENLHRKYLWIDQTLKKSMGY